MAKKRQIPISGRCQAIAKSGKQCAAPAVRDKSFCSLHLQPGRAAELGRQGGRKNRSQVLGPSNEPTVAPDGPAEIFQMLGRAFVSVFAGSMSPKVGATLGFMAGNLLKAYEGATFERRISELEARNRELSQLAELPAPPARVVIVKVPTQEEFDRAIEAEFGKPATGTC